MPYGQDPAVGGYGADPVAGAAPPPPQPAPAAPVQPSQADLDTQAEYLARVASNPEKPQNMNREALQYKLIHPEMAFDAIESNLDTLRQEAIAKKVNWQTVSQQHPVLAKLIQRDPETMHLALSEAGTLQGIQNYLGFVPDKDSAIGYRYVPGGSVETFGRAALYGTNSALYGLGRAFATAMAVAEEKIGIDKYDSAIPGFKGWRDLAGYYAKGQQWNADRIHVDTHGDSLKDSGKLVRGVHGAVESMASLLPYAIELGVSKGIGGSSLAFNALMNVGAIFDTLKSKGVSDEKALVASATGATALGKVMELSPLNRINDAFSTAATKAAMDRVLQGAGVSIGKVIRAGVLRAGVDAFSGQVALGLQRATMQLVTSTSGKDLKEVPKEFYRGTFHDPSLLGFHAVGLAGTFGRTFRSAKDLTDLHNFIDQVEKANPDPIAASLREGATQDVANQPASHRAIFLPVDRFLEAADKLGKDPRALAVEFMQDGGAAYDVALATRSDHLKIPIERSADVIKAGLTDAIKEHGRFDQTLLSKSDLEEQGLHLKTTFDAEYRAATKLDPDNLGPADVALYRAAQAHATLVGEKDGTAVPRLIAEVRTMAKLHPEMTHREIFNGLFGKEGVYGGEARGKYPAPKVEMRLDAGAEPRLYRYQHTDSPMELIVSQDPEMPDHRSATYMLKGASDDAKIYEGLRGKGYATATYLRALLDAQKAGQGWTSDTIRSDASERMYARLTKMGLPFKLINSFDQMTPEAQARYKADVEKTKGSGWTSVEGGASARDAFGDRYVLSPKDLAGVDVKLHLEKLTGEVDRLRPDDLIEQAQAVSGHGDDRWFDAFKTDQEKRSAFEAAAKADEAATAELKKALVNNDRRLMDGARDSALTEAKALAAKNPALLAIRAIRGNVEHLAPEQRAALTRPDGKPYRLLASEIDSILGPGAAEELKGKLGNAITENPGKAIAARDLAQILGFQHSPEGLAEKNLLHAIRETPDEKTFVEKAAQSVLDQRYGPDLLTNPAPLMGAALDAVHTPAATERLLGLYRKLSEGLDPTTQARSALTPEAWLDHARRLVSLKSLEEIDPHFFAKSEGSRISRALEAAEAGKAPEAAKHAEAALLYHHLYMAAREATDAAGKAKRDLSRAAESELGGKRLGFADPHAGDDGMNHYQRGREAALVAAGLLHERAGADYSKAVSELIDRAEEVGHADYLDGVNWNKDVIQKLIDNKAGWGALSIEEARQLHAFVRNLDTLGRKVEEARGTGVDDRSANIAKYLTNDGIRSPKDPLHLDQNLQKVEEQAGVKGVLRQVKDRLLVPLRMLGIVDSPPNWQSELLLRHVGPEGLKIQNEKREAYIRRDAIFRELYQPWKEIHDKTMLDRSIHKEAVGAIDMLDPQRKGQVDVDRVTYGWLLNLARWYGDADGRIRILKGFNLTPDRVEAVLAKYLTHEQLSHIQAEKDLIDRDWFPKLADAQLRRTGNPLPRSQPAGFEINGKQYRGGHVTLSYDSRPGAYVDLRKALNDSTLGTRAVMENGFFHERVGAPKALPDLSNLTAPQTMLDMAHHLAVGDFLLRTKEVLLNPETAGVINRYVGDNGARVFQGWLMRIASETRGGPDKMEPGQRESIRNMRVLRSGLILAYTSGKLTIPFAHATHPFMVGTMLHGPGFAAKYTLPAFNEMVTGTTNWLATGINPFTEAAQAESPYLRLRKTSTPDDIARLYFEREVAQSGAPKAVIEKVGEGLEKFGTMPLRIMDEVFSASIYRARYRHALDTLDRSQFETSDAVHEAAVKLAEAEVDRSMPNFAQHAISSFTASRSGFQSMITPLMGYYATVRDLYRSKMFEKVDAATRRHEAQHGEEAPPWYRTAKTIEWRAALTLPVVLGLGLGAYLKGSGPKVGEDPPEWAQWSGGYWQNDFPATLGAFTLDAGREAAVRMSELHPLLGHAAETANDAVGSRRMGNYTPSALIFSPFTDVGRAVEKTRLEKYDAGDAAISWGRALAPMAGAPAAPIVNIGGMLVNHEEFRDSLPTSKAAQTLDVLDHLIYSHQYGRGEKYQRSTPLMDLKDAVEEAHRTDKGGRRSLPW